MAHYLVYWKPATVVADRDVDVLRHAASNQFGRLATQDVLWIVTSEEPGDLVLVGRMRVDRVVNQAEAEKATLSNHLWQAEYHAICDSPEPKIILDITPLALALSFCGAIDELPEKFTGKNLQTMRQLDDESAEMLESVWNRKEQYIHSGEK